MFNGYRVSVWDDEKVLERMDNTELYFKMIKKKKSKFYAYVTKRKTTLTGRCHGPLTYPSHPSVYMLRAIFLFLFLGTGKTLTKDLGKGHFNHLGFCT